MIYGDIPFLDENAIVNSDIDFNKYDTNNNNINSPTTTTTNLNSNNNVNLNTKINPDVNDLIKKCLQKNSADRLRLEEILDHRWLCPAPSVND